MGINALGSQLPLRREFMFCQSSAKCAAGRRVRLTRRPAIPLRHNCQSPGFACIKQIAVMQADEFTHRLQLIEAQKDFAHLKDSQQIPPLMLAKLNFLSALLQHDRVNESLVELLPYYERESLEEMSAEVQAALFVSIVHCLAGKEVVTYFRRERGYLRKEKALFGWKKCYIDCDSRLLSLADSRTAPVPFQQLDIANLWVSRYYKYYKKKTIFALYHQTVKYVLGFDQETTCRRIHETLTALVSEHREWKCTTFQPPSPLPQDKPERLGPESRKVEEGIICEELEFLSSLQAKLADFSLSNEGFRLLKNIDQGRILVNEARGIVRVSLIASDANELSLLENYALQEWNSSVAKLTLLGKPRSNSYLARLQTARYSLISYPRECLVTLTYYQPCACRADPALESNSYLIIEATPNTEPSSGTVQMDLKQVVELARSEENNNVLLLTVTTLADFKGYASAQDNIAMTLHLVGNLTDLLAQAKKHPRQTMFEKLICPCKREGPQRRGSRIVTDFSLPSEQNISNDDEFSDRNATRNGTRKLSLKGNESEVTVMVQALIRGVRNQAILDLMKSRKHEGYALRHRFKEKDEVFAEPEGENRDYLLQGRRWEFKGDEFVFIDEECLAAQKDILKMIIKQLGSNLLAGKSIMNMSLPVEIFAKCSMLDLIAQSLGFLPHFLTRAVRETNPLEQMKLVTCAFMFISATAPNIEKPFNPILGETFQGQYGDYSVGLEQISHHPPISALYMRSKEVELYGNFEVTLDMGLNSAYSKVNNWLHLRILPTNSHFKIKAPDIELGGLMYGNRTLKFAHRGYVYEHTSQLFCEMSIGKDKKRIYEREKLGPADLAGGIFKVRPEFAEKVQQQTGKKTFEGLKPEDVMQSCCFISGKWFGNISFDKVSYKSITEGPFPEKCTKLKYLLASDSIFREDVIFKIWKDNEGSNREKQRLQNLQRGDRKLRQRLGRK